MRTEPIILGSQVVPTGNWSNRLGAGAPVAAFEIHGKGTLVSIENGNPLKYEVLFEGGDRFYYFINEIKQADK